MRQRSSLPSTPSAETCHSLLRQRDSRVGEVEDEEENRRLYQIAYRAVPSTAHEARVKPPAGATGASISIASPPFCEKTDVDDGERRLSPPHNLALTVPTAQSFLP